MYSSVAVIYSIQATCILYGHGDQCDGNTVYCHIHGIIIGFALATEPFSVMTNIHLFSYLFFSVISTLFFSVHNFCLPLNSLQSDRDHREEEPPYCMLLYSSHYSLWLAVIVLYLGPMDMPSMWR